MAELTIVATALAAFLGAPLWTIIPAAAVLLAIFVFEQRKSLPDEASLGVPQALVAAARKSARQAVLASGAVYGVGAVARLSLVALMPS